MQMLFVGLIINQPSKKNMLKASEYFWNFQGFEPLSFDYFYQMLNSYDELIR
jgi:hypothetical protein